MQFNICLSDKNVKKEKNKKDKREKKTNDTYSVVEETRTCPFYTVYNAFLSAIVYRYSLDSTYQ